MGINILFKEKQIQWDNDKIPLKTISTIKDCNFVKMLYSIYINSLHTNSSILQEVEERQNKMLDCDYMIVIIGNMVANLDINNSSKDKIKHSQGL